MATVVYTISDFENFKWANNNGFVLPENTIELINTLSQQVGAPNYVKTPSFTNNTEKPNYKKKRRPADEIKSDDWQCLRSFQKTEFVKTDGIEKEIDGIRLLINKLTEKTYDKIIEKLFVTLDEINDNEKYDAEYINKIGYAIFNMATSNKFNSNVYAKLASALQNRYEFMTDIITFNINEFMKLFEKMEFVSPDENYDKFCEMNIVNEKRRAMSMFLISLYKNNVITLEFIFDNIKNIQNMIVNEDNMKNSNKITENEELVENLYILLTNISVHVLKTYGDWDEIYNNVVKIKMVDTKICTGISSKTKFKHMDILDKLK
jgi:cytochrome oxidase Cu insertion factor (SCO1/SenC/PrrC family)